MQPENVDGRNIPFYRIRKVPMLFAATGENVDGRNIPFYRSDCTPKEFKDNIPTRLPSSRDKTVRVPLWKALAIAEAYYKEHQELLRGCR